MLETFLIYGYITLIECHCHIALPDAESALGTGSPPYSTKYLMIIKLPEFLI